MKFFPFLEKASQGLIFLLEFLFSTTGVSIEKKSYLIETDTLFLTHLKQAVKVRADIEVSCYTYEGIDAIKAALRAGLECSTEQIPLNIQLIAPPLYVVTTSTTEHKVGQLRGFKRICSQKCLRINVFTQIFDPYKTLIQMRICLKSSFDLLLLILCRIK